LTAPHPIKAVPVSMGRPFTVTVRIAHVEFPCAVKGDVTPVTVEVRYRAVSASLEYRSLEEAVKAIARSKPWTAEELALTLSRLIADTLLANHPPELYGAIRVRVRLHFQETPDTSVEVEAAAP